MKHKGTLLTDTERRWMERIQNDSKFTVYKRRGSNRSEEKPHTYANLKEYMKLSDRVDELLSLALKGLHEQRENKGI